MYDFYYLWPALLTVALFVNFVYVARRLVVAFNSAPLTEQAAIGTLILHTTNISMIVTGLVWMVFLVGDAVTL